MFGMVKTLVSLVKILGKWTFSSNLLKFKEQDVSERSSVFAKEYEFSCNWFLINGQYVLNFLRC